VTGFRKELAWSATATEQLLKVLTDKKIWAAAKSFRGHHRDISRCT